MIKDLLKDYCISDRRLKQDRNVNINFTYEEISKIMNIPVQEVKALEASAIKKIKHPRIGKKLKEYMQN
jgi:DNA-directed RNA polymerase sigma subunit (sigma70/sigma32)